MLIDAIVLVGGRPLLDAGGSTPRVGPTPLGLALDAASAARYIVVVGSVTEEEARPASASDVPDLDDRIHMTRADPPHGGPVAALAVALKTLAGLDGRPADDILVLADDVTHPGAAVSALLDAVDSTRSRQVAGVVAVDATGHPRPLLAVYDAARLTDAITSLGPSAADASMRSVLEQLYLVAVAVPADSDADPRR